MLHLHSSYVWSGWNLSLQPSRWSAWIVSLKIQNSIWFSLKLFYKSRFLYLMNIRKFVASHHTTVALMFSLHSSGYLFVYDTHRRARSVNLTMRVKKMKQKGVQVSSGWPESKGQVTRAVTPFEMKCWLLSALFDWKECETIRWLKLSELNRARRNRLLKSAELKGIH